MAKSTTKVTKMEIAREVFRKHHNDNNEIISDMRRIDIVHEIASAAKLSTAGAQNYYQRLAWEGFE